MVDFSKKIQQKRIKTIVDPLQIYDSLDRRSEKNGPLRPGQEKILQEWFSNRESDKDIVLKMNTGSGKTLIGLLILESRRRQYNSMEVFLCTNKNLVTQTVEQANLFGVNVCELDSLNHIPTEAISGEKILVTTVQKMFNGKTEFGLNKNKFPVDGIIIDDAHSSAESIKSASRMNIVKNKHSQLYEDILRLFEEDLKKQQPGTFSDLVNYKNNSTIELPYIPVPFWAWQDRIDEVTSLISKAANGKSGLSFSWQIIKNELVSCSCIISGKSIEISPMDTTIKKFTTFCEANQRIYMSATTASDATLIMDLNVPSETIENPLCDMDERWSGEKMVLIPSLMHDSLDQDTMVSWMSSCHVGSEGIVGLVPSKFRSRVWSNNGSHVATSESINQDLINLSNGNAKLPLVLVNRYDGVDLPDSSCRVLIIDSLPFSGSLHEHYLDQIMPNSSDRQLKIAQKIEQGMGRSVRANTDYSVIILVGPDLVRFIRNDKSNRYFSAQTTAQINIGLDISKDVKNEVQQQSLGIKDPSEVKVAAKKEVVNLISQSVKRDEGWKQYYREKMEKVDYSVSETKSSDLEKIEMEAKLLNLLSDRMISTDTVSAPFNEFIDKYCSSDTEKGYYTQLLAQRMYMNSKSNSFKIQRRAYMLNRKLLLPVDEIEIPQLGVLEQGKRVENIRNLMIQKFKDYEGLKLTVDEIVSNLKFGVGSKKFEDAVDKLGKIIGFKTDRPDANYREGPDNLWSVNDSSYFLIEDKSEVKESRQTISKSESGQMNNSTSWFERKYPKTICYKFLVIPTKHIDPAGGFVEETRIIRKKGLNKLRRNFENFSREFSRIDFSNISGNEIDRLLNLHHLNIEDFIDLYSELSES